MIFWRGGVAVVVCLGAIAHAKADNRTQELAVLAKDVKTFADGEGVKRIAVGRFSPRLQKGDQYECGPGIARDLQDALSNVGLTVDPDAPHTIKGEYWGAEDTREKRAVVQFVATLQDKRTGKQLVNWRRMIYGEVEVAEMLGITVAYPPESSDKERARLLLAREDKPSASLKGNQVAESESSPYRVELLVKRGGEDAAIPPKLVDGRPFFELKKDDIYVVKITNTADHEVATELSVDGVDLFSFTEAARGGKVKPKVLVSSGKSVTIRGWPINDRQSDEFLITDYAKSVAHRLNAGEASVGMVVVKFSPSWEPGKKPAGLKFARSGISTGVGARIETPFIRTERELGSVTAVVVVRYAK